MKWIAIVLACGLLPWPSSSRAASVYRCTSASGTVVFSQTPCGRDAREVDTSAALKAGTSPNVEGVGDYAALGRIDSDCRMQELAIERRLESDLGAIDREMATLKDSMRYSANNLAGATRDNAIQTRVASLEASRTSVLGMARSDRVDLARPCDERRAQELKRQADRDAARSDRP
ncbi:MAG: DUF4124 domain-containing protein [Lysobacteraceae bacterium]|nr:MAG: DUF4124 domain-containing protein [Xanthomonadaceae bacterium]